MTFSKFQSQQDEFIQKGNIIYFHVHVRKTTIQVISQIFQKFTMGNIRTLPIANVIHLKPQKQNPMGFANFAKH